MDLGAPRAWHPGLPGDVELLKRKVSKDGKGGRRCGWSLLGVRRGLSPERGAPSVWMVTDLLLPHENGQK